MKRWKTTWLGKPALWYAENEDYVRTHDYCDEGAEIVPYEDTAHLPTISWIKDNFEYKGNRVTSHGNGLRELYVGDCFLGQVKIQLFKDLRDDTYYDYTQYQIWKFKRYLNPITWIVGNYEKLWNEVLNVQNIQYEVYSKRYYGQPKLSKPKELKNIKSIGTAVFIPKHCNCQMFVKDNDLWVKHDDYFSRLWHPPVDDIGKPQSYYLNKYFSDNRGHSKFIYHDDWGGIVLRNNAWLVIRNAVPMLLYREIDYAQVARMIWESQAKVEKIGMYDDISLEWVMFWEDVVKKTRAYLGVNV